MKKLLYSSIILTLFSISLVLFQISCQEEAVAKEEEIQNKFLYSSYESGGVKYFIANIDGSDPVQIPITLPESLGVDAPGQLTPDGKTLIFPVSVNPIEDEYAIYSVNINGTNLKKIVDNISSNQLEINQTF